MNEVSIWFLAILTPVRQLCIGIGQYKDAGKIRDTMPVFLVVIKRQQKETNENRPRSEMQLYFVPFIIMADSGVIFKNTVS